MYTEHYANDAVDKEIWTTLYLRGVIFNLWPKALLEYQNYFHDANIVKDYINKGIMSSSYNKSKRIGFGGLDLTNDPRVEVTPLPDRPTRSNFNYTVTKF